MVRGFGSGASAGLRWNAILRRSIGSSGGRQLEYQQPSPLLLSIFSTYRWSIHASSVESTPPENKTAARASLGSSATVILRDEAETACPCWGTGMFSVLCLVLRSRCSRNRSAAACGIGGISAGGRSVMIG